MNIITLIFKGIILGVVLLIPGASASTLAILMGIYDKIIFSVSDIFKNFKKSIQYLFPIGIGIFIGAILASIIITHLFDNYSYIIYAIFLGISLGCLPTTYKERGIIIRNSKNILSIIITFLLSLVFSYTMISSNEDIDINYITYFMLFISGIVGAIGCIIPGISGMILIMILGYYPLILKSINELIMLNNFFTNFSLLACFGIGLILGVILTSKIIIKLINKWPIYVNHCVFGFILGSIFYIVIKILQQNLNFYQTLIVVVSTIISYILVSIIMKMSKKI